MGHNPIDPLLVVQRRRVDRAMDEVRARNEQQHRMELDRDRTYGLWLQVQERKQRERQNRDEEIAARMWNRMVLTEIVVGVSRVEWWQARVEEQERALQSADSALGEACVAAAAARREYRHTCARYESLLMLANERRRALSQSQSRAEEHTVEDMIGCPSQGVG